MLEVEDAWSLKMLEDAWNLKMLEELERVGQYPAAAFPSVIGSL
jgi:hypothetical protein